jgi:hypothetical protein
VRLTRAPSQGVGRFTFRGNLRQTRHGWLRLTPAYSLHLVRALVEARPRRELPVLDPFSGSGTTLLSCAELSVPCDAVELNPFLRWLSRAKVARYDRAAVAAAAGAISDAATRARRAREAAAWRPPLHNIERWWDAPTLDALSRAFASLSAAGLGPRAADLGRLAFCRTLVAVSNASFRHQSMSFADARERTARDARREVGDTLLAAFGEVAQAAAEPLPRWRGRVFLGDSRDVAGVVGEGRYGAVITSPPYANRMSYVRELRPYMYWLGHLEDGRAAGALDWEAIGGTWGSATSNLARWTAPPGARPAFRGFRRLLAAIETKSSLLSRYVERYVFDVRAHLQSLRPVVADGGSLHYVVGNSKFFDVLVPVEDILAAEMRAAGFSRPRVERLRKRTSKPELFEFAVSARG